MKVFIPSGSLTKVLATMIVMWNLASAAPVASPSSAPAKSSSDNTFKVLVSCADKDKDPSKRYATPLLQSSYHVQCDVSSQTTPLSCSLTSNSTCCYEGNNGIFMSTQFWDYNPATGPPDLFTTHGLWSDLCGGGYQQYCNPSWEITNVTSILQEAGAHDLLAEMQYTWKNNADTDESLWLHEFNKHGTCMDTVNPSCYSSDSYKYQYVVDFFKTAVDLEKTVPTYKFLEAAGITPSDTKQYSKADMLAAINNSTFGHSAYLGCNNNGALQEVWYHFNLRGAVANGMFVPIESPVGTGKCPDKIWYYPKGYKGAPQVLPSTTSKGKLDISGESGCLGSDGKWTVSNCGTFNVTNDGFGNLIIASAAGPCAVTKSVLSCAAGNTGSQFTKDASGLIQYGGNKQWSAASAPSGSSSVEISSGSSKSKVFSFKFDASS